MMPVPVVAVIGAGQAGFQAAASLRDGGFAGRILLIGDEPALPYQRPPLSKSYLAGQSGVDDLWLRPAEFYAKQSIDLIYGDAVTKIDQGERRLHLASGIELSWSDLILATGAGCRLLPVPGAELDGVFALRTLAEADALRQRLNGSSEVVVVGAGFIGLEFAAVALAAGARVHIV
ncbi:MAG: FAD-dependent oxidoreductase, partial [Alphaproteobacteria bacterium]|nr:FAD-dependent oxidoreductase [Alphaproteobacteria bacterium]